MINVIKEQKDFSQTKNDFKKKAQFISYGFQGMSE